MKKQRIRPILIEGVQPVVDGGRYPCKRAVGDRLEVSADIFKEGHDLLDAVILYRAVDESRWSEAPMRPVGNDRSGQFPLERNTRYAFTIEGVDESFGSSVEEIERRTAGGQDDLRKRAAGGDELVRRAAAQAAADEAGRFASRSSATMPPPASRPASPCSSTPRSVRSSRGSGPQGPRPL